MKIYVLLANWTISIALDGLLFCPLYEKHYLLTLPDNDAHKWRLRRLFSFTIKHLLQFFEHHSCILDEYLVM